MNLAQASSSAALAAVGALCNNGTLKFYTASMPASPETAVAAQTLLATFTFSASAFGAPTYSSPNETMAASFVASSVTPAANGTVAWARAFKSDGTTVVADFTVGTSASDILVASTTISTSVPMTISSFNLTQPAV